MRLVAKVNMQHLSACGDHNAPAWADQYSLVFFSFNPIHCDCSIRVWVCLCYCLRYRNWFRLRIFVYYVVRAPRGNGGSTDACAPHKSLPDSQADQYFAGASILDAFTVGICMFDRILMDVAEAIENF